MFTVREFQDDSDYDLMVQIEDAVRPDESDSADFWREEDNESKKHYLKRFLAFDDGQVIGSAELVAGYWWSEPHQYFLWAAVLPHYQGRGAGKQLHRAMCDALGDRPIHALVASVRDDMQRGVRFVEDRGFQFMQRDAASELCLAAFDPTSVADVQTKLSQHEIEILAVDQLRQRDPHWLTKIYDLHWELVQDVPSTELRKQLTLEQWQERYVYGSQVDLSLLFVARIGEQLIGMSQLKTDSKGRAVLWSGITGVVRSWRRKGVATALKRAGIDQARRANIERIVTDNEENNPMYQLNLALGFRPIPSWMTYKKTEGIR